MENNYIVSIKIDSSNQIIHATLKNGEIKTREEIIKEIESGKSVYWIHNGKDDVWVHGGYIHTYMKDKYSSDDLVEAGVKIEI